MPLAALASMRLAALLGAAPPAPLPTVHTGGTEYVSLAEASEQMGLRVERVPNLPTVILKEGAKPVARLVDHSRETDIAGLRVFFGDPVVERSGGFYISRADYLFHLLPRLRPGLLSAVPRPPHVIVVDAGHGGVDHGTENPRLKIMEKTYTLDVALRLRKLLEAAGYKVYMIRETDVTVSKENRSAIANQWSPDLFVSVHFNSLYPNTKTKGVEVMEFPSRGQRSTDSWSPNKPNDAEAVDSPINAFSVWNTLLGSKLHRRLLDSLRDGDRGEKFEHLAVLRGLDCPGVLVEPAFLSSDEEAGRLGQPAFRDQIAAAVLAGIEDYAAELALLRALAPGPAATPKPGPQRAPSGAARTVPTRPVPGA